MIYIYTKEMCSACEEKKERYRIMGVEYVERDADRLKNPGGDVDEIDRRAFAQLAMQNNMLPVEVEM